MYTGSISIVSHRKQLLLFINLLQSGDVEMIHAGIEEHGFVSRTIGTVSRKFAVHVSVAGQVNL